MSVQKFFKVEREQATLIVTPLGDYPGFRHHELHYEINTVLHLLDDPDVKNLVVDFGSVDMLSSTILSALLRLMRKPSLEGGQALLCNASEELQEVLQTMNLAKLWPYFSSREEALKAINA